MAQVAVKICCISSLEEAHLAVKAGAKVLGLVGPMPSGPGIISNELIAEIASQVPSDIKTFLLTSETSTQGIIDHYRRVNTTSIQIVDELKEGSYSDLRAALPSVELIQVIHVIDESSIERAVVVAKDVDILLLDSGNPNLEIKELGGTGRVHNWSLSKQIVDTVSIPVYLAGGLNSSNISSAINTVRPYGVDLCSGVRTNKLLDPSKLGAFFEAVKSTV